MGREILLIAASGILLGLAIVALPNEFLFSKTVPNSFWTEYFPLPFGAGWFLSFLSLIPVIWLASSTSKASTCGIVAVVASVMVAVPISVAMTERWFSLGSLIYQYIWVGIICFPPLILHVSLRWGASVLTSRWLTSRSKPTPKNGAV